MTKIINNKYIIINKIGEGSFGAIYKGQNIRTKEYVAIKIEPIQSETKLLKNETIVYQFLNEVQYIPHLKWYGKDTYNYYMVINLLGESLQSLKDKKQIFPLKFVLKIGINIIYILQNIHDKGLVHRDIKPDNFLFGLKEVNKLYLIDFGFCKSFVNGGNHIEIKRTNNLIGSKTFASINSHNFLELSRRDDLESLGYMMIYFYLGSLSWRDISNLNSSDDVNEKIKEIKNSIINESKLPNVLINYIKYVKSLEFKERPNYNFIINDFKKEIDSIS
jgi:serine/threonine protein kinase